MNKTAGSYMTLQGLLSGIYMHNISSKKTSKTDLSIMTRNYENTLWFVCHTSDKIFRWCVKMQLVATSASKVIELNFACTQCSNKKIYIYLLYKTIFLRTRIMWWSFWIIPCLSRWVKYKLNRWINWTDKK